MCPGGKEANQDMNLLLRPLIDDLKWLWNKGMTVTYTQKIVDSNHREVSRKISRSIRAALILISCDSPAARKVMGFTGTYTCRNYLNFMIRVSSSYAWCSQAFAKLVTCAKKNLNNSRIRMALPCMTALVTTTRNGNREVAKTMKSIPNCKTTYTTSLSADPHIFIKIFIHIYYACYC